MTVAELIVLLQQMPQDMKVTYAHDVADPDVREVQVVTDYQYPRDTAKTTYVQLS